MSAIRDPESYVAAVARGLAGQIPPPLDHEDLCQAGMIGLLQAAKNHDPSRGARFDSYAWYRIRGAMLDECRSMDWTPRSVYRGAREGAEVADHTLISYERLSEEDTPASPGPAIEEHVDLWRAVTTIPIRERRILAMYYYYGLKQWEIGGVLGITEARVSQLRSRGLRELRAGLA